MFWFFTKKRELESVREEAKKGFESVKKDILSVSEWIKHLDSEKNNHKQEIDTVKQELSTLYSEVEAIKNALSILNNFNSPQVFGQSTKTTKRLLDKQTPVLLNQTAVQTDVYTPNLNDFSITERAILFVLLNTDMKLSYDDLATMLNKEKSTIRGQMNSIKAKDKYLVEEIIEKNGKKRVFISEKMKEKLLKKQKVRVKHDKKE